MWNVVSLLIGLSVGVVIAQPAGLCDGTLQNVLKQKIEKFKQENLSSLNLIDKAYAQEEEPPYEREIREEEIWVPKVLELHESSLEYITPPGFGTISPCTVSENCRYSINFAEAGSTTAKLVFYSNTPTIELATNTVAEILSDETCLSKEKDTLYNTNITKSFEDPGMKADATYWHEIVSEVLSLGNSSGIKSIADLNKLHDELIYTEVGEVFDKNSDLIKIGHPAGDIYMHEFERQTYRKFRIKVNQKCK
jgi:hypothetical protein